MITNTFIDNYNTCKKQCFDTAVITDTKGQKVGKVIVRYTDAMYGYNNETGIVFYHDENHNIDLKTRLKKSSYNRESVYYLLKNVVKVTKITGYHNRVFYDYSMKPPKTDNKQNIESISACTEITGFTIGKTKYYILWV